MIVDNLEKTVISEPEAKKVAMRGRRFRFSGHQTFPLRIAWIPKAVAEIVAGRDPLTNIDGGIVTLGLGKNMVEALRCWIEAYGVANMTKDGWALTPTGEAVFKPDTGLDPYLEDVSTAWLLHWNISTNAKSPFFGWECLFNRWPATEFSASEVLQAFRQEADEPGKYNKPASGVTLKQHWEVLLHSYRPTTHSRKGEDHLDSAMSLLGLIRIAGERQNASGKWEPLFAFDAGRKRSLPQQLFTFFIHDWWNRFHPDEMTLPIRELVLGDYSPGRILKMQEPEILERLSEIEKKHPSMFQVMESTNLRQLQRLHRKTGTASLKSAYNSPRFI